MLAQTAQFRHAELQYSSYTSDFRSHSRPFTTSRPTGKERSTRRTRGRATRQHVQQLARRHYSVVQSLASAGPDQSAAATRAGAVRVVILGGTGRVGSSTALTLLSDESSKTGQLQVVVASRSRESYDKAVRRKPALGRAQFLECDIDSTESLAAALEGADLVVHCAGPFQRKLGCSVIEAAIASNTPYLDVCDDGDFAQRVRGYHEQAQQAGVPAITTGGIYPGISNVMAAHMISISRRQYDEHWNFVEHAGSNGKMPVEPERVLYSYFTAGSGGAGPTILETSMLLAGTPVVAFSGGKKVEVPPVSGERVVDFGRGVGLKSVYLYHLPEVESTHECLAVPSVSARFGTDPHIWNLAMVAVARLAPKGFLADRAKSKWLARAANPWVRLLDPVVGECVAMRVDVELADGTIAAGLYVHRLLSVCVGKCIAAFARNMLAGGTRPGVWFPEQPEAVKDRRTLLQQAAEGTEVFILNRPPWALESDPVQIGMGFYW